MDISVKASEAGQQSQVFRAFVISTVALNDDVERIVCVVTDDVSMKVEVAYEGASYEELRAACLRAVSRVGGVQALRELKPGDVIDLSTSGPANPTPEQAALNAFLAAYAVLQSANRKVAAGLLEADDPDVQAARDAARKAYQSIYIGIG